MDTRAVATEIATEAALGILKSITIPPCPAVASSLMEEARRAEVDFVRINRLISGDVSLAAAMIKTANSPFFALRTKARTVQQAISVLGIKNIINIVTGLCLQQALSPKGVSMERFWDRSNFHAAVSGRLARRRRRIGSDDAYTFGLFHDCGIPILMQRFPDYKETLALANASAEPALKVENERHGTDHALVGAMLARNWQLPPVVIHAIQIHHDLDVLHPGLEVAPDPAHQLVAISVVADHLIANFLQVADDTEWRCHGERALDFLELGEDELVDLRDEVGEELAEIRATRG